MGDHRIAVGFRVNDQPIVYYLQESRLELYRAPSAGYPVSMLMLQLIPDNSR